MQADPRYTVYRQLTRDITVYRQPGQAKPGKVSQNRSVMVQSELHLSGSRRHLNTFLAILKRPVCPLTSLGLCLSLGRRVPNPRRRTFKNIVNIQLKTNAFLDFLIFIIIERDPSPLRPDKTSG